MYANIIVGKIQVKDGQVLASPLSEEEYETKQLETNAAIDMIAAQLVFSGCSPSFQPLSMCLIDKDVLLCSTPRYTTPAKCTKDDVLAKVNDAFDTAFLYPVLHGALYPKFIYSVADSGVTKHLDGQLDDQIRITGFDYASLRLSDTWSDPVSSGGKAVRPLEIGHMPMLIYHDRKTTLEYDKYAVHGRVLSHWTDISFLMSNMHDSVLIEDVDRVPLVEEFLKRAKDHVNHELSLAPQESQSRHWYVPSTLPWERISDWKFIVNSRDSTGYYDLLVDKSGPPYMGASRKNLSNQAFKGRMNYIGIGRHVMGLENDVIYGSSIATRENRLDKVVDIRMMIELRKSSAVRRLYGLFSDHEHIIALFDTRQVRFNRFAELGEGPNGLPRRMGYAEDVLNGVLYIMGYRGDIGGVWVGGLYDFFGKPLQESKGREGDIGYGRHLIHGNIVPDNIYYDRETDKACIGGFDYCTVWASKEKQLLKFQNDLQLPDDAYHPYHSPDMMEYRYSNGRLGPDASEEERALFKQHPGRLIYADLFSAAMFAYDLWRGREVHESDVRIANGGKERGEDEHTIDRVMRYHQALYTSKERKKEMGWPKFDTILKELLPEWLAEDRLPFEVTNSQNIVSLESTLGATQQNQPESKRQMKSRRQSIGSLSSMDYYESDAGASQRTEVVPTDEEDDYDETEHNRIAAGKKKAPTIEAPTMAEILRKFDEDDGDNGDTFSLPSVFPTIRPGEPIDSYEGYDVDDYMEETPDLNPDLPQEIVDGAKALQQIVTSGLSSTAEYRTLPKHYLPTKLGKYPDVQGGTYHHIPESASPTLTEIFSKAVRHKGQPPFGWSQIFPPEPGSIGAMLGVNVVSADPSSTRQRMASSSAASSSEHSEYTSYSSHGDTDDDSYRASQNESNTSSSGSESSSDSEHVRVKASSRHPGKLLVRQGGNRMLEEVEEEEEESPSSHGDTNDSTAEEVNDSEEMSEYEKDTGEEEEEAYFQQHRPPRRNRPQNVERSPGKTRDQKPKRNLRSQQKVVNLIDTSSDDDDDLL